jgi:hypothetical protein
MSATILQAPPLTASPTAAGTSARARWAGRVLTGITVLFLTFDVAIKLAGAKAAVDGTVQLGYQPYHVLTIGLIGLVCLVLYVIPRTAPIGAVLWTGYLGGAIATQLRVDNPLFSHTLFPIYVAAIIWGGLYLRGDPRVRALIRPARTR